MKKTLFTLLVVCMMISVSALISCNKSNLTATLTTDQKIIGKWTMKTAIGNYTTLGINSKDTTRFTPADYFDFKADGTLSIMETNKSYSGKWKIMNDKLFITNTNYLDYASGFDLPVLNNTDLQLYYTETTSYSSMEQKLNLTK